MKLRVFRSDKGDCLLVVGSDGGRILSDGGMRQSFEASVAKHLESEDLDLVCVSHVDDDHIAGILQLLDNAMAWKVFKFHKDKGEDVNPPDVPRPPRIKRVWHNAFHDQIGENAADAADLLAAMVPLLANVSDEQLRNAAIENHSIVNSNKQAIQVSQRLRPEQLDIPLNENNKLIMVRDRQRAFKFGGLGVEIIAPFEEGLEVFKKAWNDWLRNNKEQVKKLRAKAKEHARSLEDDMERLMLPIELSPGELGDRKAVTPPNLASIMLFVKDGDQTLLLTGDGHADDALKGLEHINALKSDGTLHVNILKVPHHGSEHNMTADFARRITADHYVFCGNGFSGNPEPIVIKTLFEARSRDRAGPERKFKFWFNSSQTSEVAKRDRAKHMADIQQQVEEFKQQDNRLAFHFLRNGDFFDLTP